MLYVQPVLCILKIENIEYRLGYHGAATFYGNTGIEL